MQAFQGRPSLSAERPRNEKPRRKAGSSPPEQPGRSSDFSEDRIRFSAFPVCCIPFPDRTVSSLFRTESSMRYALRHVRTAILPEKAARTFREPSKNSGIAMTEYDSPALSSERRGHRFPFYLHPPSGFSEHRSATLSDKIASRATYDKELRRKFCYRTDGSAALVLFLRNRLFADRPFAFCRSSRTFSRPPRPAKQERYVSCE